MASEREDEAKLRREAIDLGLAPPAFREESLAPAVDGELVSALVRRELPEDQAMAVFRLVYSFRSWNRAYTKLLAEEFRRKYPGGEVHGGPDQSLGT